MPLSTPARSQATGAERLPRVLVLLATRNGRPWLAEQIESIVGQQGVELEVRASDDASTDGTWDELERRQASDRRWSVARQDPASGSAGANFRRLYLEADAAGHDHVALADQDDLWHPDKLARAVERLERTGADGYSSAVEAFWPNGRVRLIGQHPAVRAADFLFEGAGQGCTFVMKTSLFDAVQRFCRQHPGETALLHYHDWLVYLLARAWNRRWTFDPVPGLRYRQHAGNEIGARSGISAITRRIALIRHGWYRSQVAAASRLYLLAGGRDPVASELAKRLSTQVARRPLRDRTELAGRLLASSRRRLTDRAVLALSAFAGWL